jgi:hypothetical protein
MKIYFLVCFILLALVVLRVLAEAIEYKRAHPYIKWKKTGTLHGICTWLKLFIIFCVPLVNLFLFVGIFICADKAIFEDALRKNIE